MKKKFLLSFVLALISIFALGAVCVSAAQYGDLTYTVSNGYVTITDCDTSVTEVTIPQEIDGCPVTSIGNYAFDGCKDLTSIAIPDGVTSVGVNAFLNCVGLTSVTIPDSVTNMGSNAWFCCYNISNVYISDIASWCNISFGNSYSNPMYAGGKLCLNQEQITSLVIPDSVTSLNNYVFSGCGSLTDIIIPNSVTSIGEKAFVDCDSLANVTIPNSVKNIGNDAFYRCYNISSIYISDIGAWCKLKFGNLSSNPLRYGGKLYLNRELLTSMTIPDSISILNGNTFYGCSSLTSVTIPNSVTSIGNYAFRDCSSLKSVTISDNVVNIGVGAFYGCGSLENIILPDSLTNIKDNTFYNCSSLVRITIPNGVTDIGYEAFYNCANLVSITMPKDITKIDGCAFFYCYNISEVYMSDIESWCKINFEGVHSNPLSCGGKLYINQEPVTKLVIPDSITSLKDCVFSGCSSLTDIIIPNSVTSIGYEAFYKCVNLVNITMPNSITSIGAQTFYNCSSLTDITIPNGVTNIEHDMFYECRSLTSITIPSSVTDFGENAFYSCYDLEKVYISDILSWYGILFHNPYSTPLRYGGKLYINQEPITKLVISDSVTSLKNYVFSGCSGLTDVVIPDSVTSIGYGAFDGCKDLTSIIIPDSVTSLRNYAFQDCANLISLSVGRGVTTIPENAFYLCQNLKYVCLPKELLYIRNDAFNDCPNIEKVFYAGSEDEWNNILKYNRNENLTTKEIIYNAAKRTYKFDTGCDASVSEITDYAVFVQPEAENGDKKLAGWYDNKNFSGSPVVFPYYGSAETLYAKWTDKTGLGFDDAFTAEANREYTVTTTDVGQTIYYEFVPRFTGEYRFFSKGSLDTYGYLYNSDRNQLVSDNNSGEGNNFKIAYNLTAGEKYYIAVNCLSGYGRFTLATETDCVESTKTVCVTATTGEKIFITIPKYLPQNARIILACYKGEKFVEMKSAPNTDETVYFIVNTDFDFAKVMVWDSIGTMIPVCRAEDVDKIS